MESQTTALVLCLGTACRMRPLSLTCPKALLPFCGRPLLEYLLEQFRASPIKNVILVAGRNEGDFERYTIWGRANGMDIQVLRCALEYGSGGVIKHVVESTNSNADRLAIVYGDSLLRIDFAAMLSAHDAKQASGCEITVAWHTPDDLVISGRSHTSHGILWLTPDGRCIRFVEKPLLAELSSQCASSGVFVMNQSVISRLGKERPLDLSADFLSKTASGATSPVFGFCLDNGYRFDIGTIQEYVRRQFAVLDKVIRLDGVPHERIRKTDNVSNDRMEPGRVFLGHACQIGSGVRLLGHNIIGDGVSIGENTELKECVVLDGTTIGSEVKMVGSVLGRVCNIYSGVELHTGTVLGDFSIVV